MNRHQKFYLFSLFCAILPLYSGAQVNTLNFFSLSREQGLSNNSVTSIMPDKEGFIWIGTEYGLNRYDGYEFTRLQADGLPGSIPEDHVEELFLSSAGDLWVGFNSTGVCRYDYTGKKFIPYKLGSFPQSWAPGMIKDITQDRDSVIYVATAGGLFYCLPGHDTFDSLPVAPDLNQDEIPEYEGLLSPAVTSVSADENEGIWIAYDDWRLTYYNPSDNKYKHYSLREYFREDQQVIITALLHFQGKVWIGSQGPGFIVFDPEKEESMILLKDEYLTIVAGITPSWNRDLLWLATGSGLVSYNTSNGDFTRFTYVRTNNRSMTSTALTSVFEDSVGVVWVGTYNSGLNYSFINKPFRHMDTGLEQYFSLSEENVTALLSDSRGDMWVGFSSGRVEYHVNQNYRRYVIPIYSLYGEYGPGTIFDLFEDSGGNIYCASWQGGIQKFDRKEFRFIPVTGTKKSYLDFFDAADIRDIAEDESGRLWLCAHGKGVYIYDPALRSLEKLVSEVDNPVSLSNDWVYNICFDRDGFAWVTSTWGISKISSSDLTVKRFINTGELPVITHNSTHVAKQDNGGNIWIGTDFGLNLYDSGKDTFFRFDRTDGLPEDHIRGLEQDSSGSYWCGTSAGMVKFSLEYDTSGVPVLVNIYHFGREDGLQSSEYAFSCSMVDGAGWLFFGGTDGVDFFDPADIQPVRILPRLAIKGIEIFGRQVYPGSSDGPPIDKNGVILFNHHQNMIGIQYVALNYFKIKENQYSYRLEPIQNEWKSTGSQRNIIFTNLSPGNYNLWLRVTTGRGQVSEEKNILKFRIIPPYWKKPWFKGISALVILLFLLSALRLYTLRLQRQKAWLENTVKKRTEELMVQSRVLEQANQELHMLNATKDKFFSIIAHDLKNPFNAILGFSELIIKDYDRISDEKRVEMLGIVHKSVTGAYSLLENLLHWSRSQTNRIEVHPAEIKVEDIIRDNHALLGPTLNNKKLSFSFECESQLKVLADRELLNTVIRNLLSNAAKFTPEKGEISVSAKMSKNRHVSIEVKDTGVGIEREDLINIFRIDVSTQKQGTAGEVGTGLGLILCKEFVEKMGGVLSLDSIKDKGTTVSFTLPAGT